MKRILCLGDSNTFGYDPRSYLGSRYPADVRWTGRIAESGYEVVNDGVNGRAFPREEELPAIAAYVREMLPLDAVVILLGTNDLLLGRTAEETGKRASAMLRAVCAAAGRSRVLLICPPVLRRGEWVREESVLRESRLLSGALRKAAAQNRVCFADSGNWEIAIAFDGVHFLPEGHRAFAERLLGTLVNPEGDG